MKRNFFIILIFIICSCSLADRIVLKNGSVLEGRIIVETGERITIESSTGQITLYRKDLGSVKKESEATNRLFAAETGLKAGNITTAIAAWKEAVDNGLSQEKFLHHLENNRERVREAISMAEQDKRRFAAEQMVDLILQSAESWELEDITSDSVNLLVSAGVILYRSHEKNAAADLFRYIPEHVLDYYPEQRSIISEVLLEESLKLVSEGRFEEALNVMESSGASRNLSYKSGKTLLFLRWGRRLREQRQWQDAAAVYAEKLSDVLPEAAVNRLEYLLNFIISEGVEISDFLAAAELAGKYSELLGHAASFDIKAKAYTAAASVLIQNGRYDEARGYIDKAASISGTYDQQLVNLCDYRQRQDTLAENDVVGHFRLGLFCREKGMLEEARRHFISAKDHPELKDAVQKQLAAIQSLSRLKMLDNALALYDSQDYASCLDTLQPLFDDTSTTTGLQEASHLASLCRERLQAESDKRPMRALVLFQQAERHFLMEDLDQALLKLQLLLDTYPDVPVAEKARSLLIQTMRRQDLKGRKQKNIQSRIQSK